MAAASDELRLECCIISRTGRDHQRKGQTCEVRFGGAGGGWGGADIISRTGRGTGRGHQHIKELRGVHVFVQQPCGCVWVPIVRTGLDERNDTASLTHPAPTCANRTRTHCHRTWPAPSAPSTAARRRWAAPPPPSSASLTGTAGGALQMRPACPSLTKCPSAWRACEHSWSSRQAQRGCCRRRSWPRMRL